MLLTGVNEAVFPTGPQFLPVFIIFVPVSMSSLKLKGIKIRRALFSIREQNHENHDYDPHYDDAND
jgi:hypothetical protein